ncbi:hypothetical protein F4802DRAFT_245887 [Xylaria palmicola]|nr:hypothetical protein F4802DRAFT_245887 [Xylaria palmicola]
MTMSAFSTTNIEGKKCTVVPRANNVGGGQLATTTTSVSPSTTSTTSTSTLIETSTTFSTSSTPSLTLTPSSTAPPNGSPLIQPVVDASTSIAEGITITPTTTSDVSPGITSSIPESVIGGSATTTTTGTGQLESSDAGAGLTNGAQNNVTGNASSTQTTVAVAGGVIGGLALLSIIAFLFWFWRKRLLKKRRSTLLTPLTPGPGPAFSGGEKDAYTISRNSLGPTTIPEKLRAVVGYNYQRLRERVNDLVTSSPKPSLDLDRGNSQFGPPDSQASRSASGTRVASDGAATSKGRFVGWWGRLTGDSSMDWKQGNDNNSGRSGNDTYTSMSNMMQTRKKGSQPDFLTLVSADEKQQQQGASGSNPGGSSNPRRSQSLGNEHFLGGLGLNFDVENPFADSNAMSHDSAKVMPLAVSGPEASNPFSDANALPAPARPANMGNGTVNGAGGPATYVQNIRRSRGYSVSAANARPPSGATTARMPSMYRVSRVSVETSDTRRNKFRSDPFDLDRPELLAQSPGPGAPGALGRRPSNPRGLPSMPQPAHARADSFTSKYSSGVSSLGEWSDPGPDVGPAAGRWDTPTFEGSLRRPSLNGKGVERREGGGSQRSVGKAM